MSSELKNTRPFQFSLRTLLLVSLAFALVMQYRSPLLELLNTDCGYRAAEWIIPSLAITMGFFAGRLLACLIARVPMRNAVMAVSWILLALASLSICYLLWSRYRWLNWPRLFYKPVQPWPFPDLFLISYHDRLDARRPAPPGYFKIHGEFYSVLLTLDVLLIAFFGWVGALLGIVAPGLPRWMAARLMQLKRWMQMLSRRVAKNRRGSPPDERN